MTALLAEPETVSAPEDEANSPAPLREGEPDSRAWQRFLEERALESGWRPLGHWRDEEGL